MKYPIGIQTFEDIIKNGFVYVDKTHLVHNLVTTSKVVFLGRPRRFGKSLLLSTIESYFQGKKELFKGLAIEALEKEWKAYPVLTLSFGRQDFTRTEVLEKGIHTFLRNAEAKYGLVHANDTLGDRFFDLLRLIYEKTGRQVVVLIDEYDKPLLDVMESKAKVEYHGEQITLEEHNRNLLKSFYATFKDADKYLRFVMLTGVTKFSQISVFSGFNQPDDISMEVQYESICGITAEEMEAYFAEPIAALAAQEQVSVEEEKVLLKQQYDGYHFGPSMQDVYNPFSLLNCFKKNFRDNYWFRTATPTYLTKLLQHTDTCFNELAGKWYDSTEFVDYKADVQRPLPMLYQSGYLTIKAYEPRRRRYQLDFPNDEVRQGFIDMLASGYLRPHTTTPSAWINRVTPAPYIK